jgi:phosphohistidine phosphatase SixA
MSVREGCMTKLLFAFMLSHALYATAEPTHVFVVRHAERAPEPKDDPALTAEGVMRAELLADTLAASNVRTIITTQRLRTQQTAAPLAKRLGVTPVVIATRAGAAPAHIEEVIAEARKASGVVLVVGHSNTVARIVAGLSSSAPAELCETTYGNIFIATPAAPARPAIQLKFGKPDMAPAAGCQ